MTLTLNQGAWQVALIMRHVGPMPRVAARVLLLLAQLCPFLFAQLLLLILFYCFIIVVIDFVAGSTRYFPFTLTLSLCNNKAVCD